MGSDTANLPSLKNRGRVLAGLCSQARTEVRDVWNVHFWSFLLPPSSQPLSLDSHAEAGIMSPMPVMCVFILSVE